MGILPMSTTGILPAIRGRDALDTETPYGVTTNTPNDAAGNARENVPAKRK